MTLYDKIKSEGVLIKDMPSGTNFYDISGQQWMKIDDQEENNNITWAASGGCISCFAACAMGVLVK